MTLYLKEKNKILSKIDILLNDNEEVDELKDELMNINKSLESINKVFSEKKQLIENFENEDKSLNNELYNIYHKRNYNFNKFKDVINSKLLNEIKNLYIEQDNNKIDEHKLKVFSNTNHINVNDIKYVINWFINVKKYIKLQDKINTKINEIKNKINELEHIENNFLIEKPEVIMKGKTNVNFKNILLNNNNIKFK